MAITAITALLSMTVACATESTPPKPDAAVGVNAGPDGKPAPFKEPVRLSSQDGVLEVRLSAHQGRVTLDTVKEPVDNFLVFGFELIKGTSSDGTTKGDNMYPAPTLRVDPGQRLIVHYDNDLQNLTIPDFYDTSYTPTGKDVPLYPAQLTEAPINLHTHGLHVSPDGQADNVLLNIPPGMGNTYVYDVPIEMPAGLYWYHSHRHMITAQQTYLGLAGMLEIGRPDGNLPIVTANKIPVRSMALQYNAVFDRRNGNHTLSNITWPQWVSTLKPAAGRELADGTYQPSLAPLAFPQTSKGAQYVTNWYAGPLSVDNRRGAHQFIPTNLQNFTSDTVKAPADPTLPDNQRDIQFTVNGQFQPDLKIKPGQTEIWSIGNFSDMAYMTLRLTETATGKHPPFALVGQDGNPFAQVHRPVDGDGTTLLVPPGSRYTIAVTMPAEGDLVLEMPPLPPSTKLPTDPAVLYTNNGTKNSPAVLGSVSVDPKFVSYADGFFMFPSQVLMRATPDAGRGRTTAFEPGQNLGAYTSFVDTSRMAVDVFRQLVVNGGFNNDKANKNDPKAFTYDFSSNLFPNVPLIQPRLNSVEEWEITNFNNDAHPMHIHVNDFQVTEITNPVLRTKTGVQMWGEDNVNLPAPIMGPNDVALEPASLKLRTHFTQFGGTFVIHCHRLNHEDNGLMAFVNVIPEVSSYAVAVPGNKGTPATVEVYDSGKGDDLIGYVTPFPGFTGTPSVAMADANGDQVLDLVVGTGEGVAPEVVVYDGADVGPGPFTHELARFTPFDPAFRGGVRVAGAKVEGNPVSDNIVVASGPGMESEVKVFSTKLPDAGTTPEVFSRFTPYPGSQSGVTLATGLVDESGRPSIVTAPGVGDAPRVKTWRFDLYTPTALAKSKGAKDPGGAPVMTSEFLAYDENYRGGISLAAGWVNGGEGGVQSVVTGQLGADGTVRVFSSGSLLDGQPAMYTHSPNHMGMTAFRQIASFVPYVGAPRDTGVRVAATSTTSGADLLLSGMGPQGPEVRRLVLVRAPDNRSMMPGPGSTLRPIPGLTGPPPLGGR